MTAGPFFSVESASFRYHMAPEPVGPFDLTVRPGSLLLVHGPSGCGKTTLARMLTGAIPHAYAGQLQGRLTLGGRSTADLPRWRIAESVATVFQNPEEQILAANVRDEVEFGLDGLGLDEEQVRHRVAGALERFDLGGLAHRDPRTLSGGEQQRLVLAALTARSPDLLVLDEPFSMLDSRSTASAVHDVARLRDGGTAVVVFEHRRTPLAGVRGAVEIELATVADVPELPALRARISPVHVRLERVGVSVGDHPLLSGIDLELRGGRSVAVFGDNGAGKTTLLRVLAGLQSHSGRVQAEPSGQPGGRSIGLCFQNPHHQIFNASVREEILWGHARMESDLYRDVIDLLALSSYEETPPLLLSEGEKKRLALAVLLMQPGLRGICLDEPTLGQDERNRAILGAIVARLSAAGYLVVVATHDREWAARWCDEFVWLDRGRVVQVGDQKILAGGVAPGAPEVRVAAA